MWKENRNEGAHRGEDEDKARRRKMVGRKARGQGLGA